MSNQDSGKSMPYNQQWTSQNQQQDPIPGQFPESSDQFFTDPSYYWGQEETGTHESQQHGIAFDITKPSNVATDDGSMEPFNPANAVYQQSATGQSSYGHNGFTDTNFEQDFIDAQFNSMLTLGDQDFDPSSASNPADDGNVPRTGVEPTERARLNDEEIPSIEDQEKERETAKKNANVQTWLKGSQLQPPSDPSEPRSREPSAPLQGNPRTNPHLSVQNESFQPKNQPENAKVPGPGVFLKIDEAAEDEDEDEEDDGSESDQSEESTTPPAGPDQSDHQSYNSFSVPPGDLKDPLPQGLTKSKPWDDSPLDRQVSSSKWQPDTSNAAISRFNQRAKDLETASLAATLGSLGSRRRSETDLDSLFSVSGISQRVPTKRDTDHGVDKARRPTLLGRMMPGRSNSHIRKRKDEDAEPQASVGTSSAPRKESQGSLHSLSSVRKMGHWRPKAPNIGTALHHTTSGPSPTSPTNLMPTVPWVSALRRVRSRSELGHVPGLAERWARQGGPPVPTLNAPHQDELDIPSTPQIPQPTQDMNRIDDLEVDDGDSPVTPIAMPFAMTKAPLDATPEAFRDHVQLLNPRLMPFMIERITQEQSRRYKRLMEFKINHDKVVKAHQCKCGDRCAASGGSPKYLPAHSASRNPEGPPVIFHIPNNSFGENSPEDEEGITSIPANFPEGVPIPPVKRLPAEFECPLCFQVKKLYKPSDWTKHVHEDVQPFTCTFPNCAEPKSFKRKADWVRHENERHRHLEQWICEHQDCGHVCYRKDNFVQHLVREHRYPEPRVRARIARGENADDSSAVAMLVENCRHETTKNPSDEPCRFCDNLCSSWKKLTVHLAKHMEQISMPLLTMIEKPPTPNSKFPNQGGWNTANANQMAGSSITYNDQNTLQQGQTSDADIFKGSLSDNIDYSSLPAQPSTFDYHPTVMAMANPLHNQSTLDSSSPYTVSTPNASVYSGPMDPRSVGTASPANAILTQQPQSGMNMSYVTNPQMTNYKAYDDTQSYQISDPNHLTASTYPPAWKSSRPSSRNQHAQYSQLNSQASNSQQLWQNDMVSASPTDENPVPVNNYTPVSNPVHDQTEMSYAQLAQFYGSQSVQQYGLQSYADPQQMQHATNTTAAQNYDTSQATSSYMNAYSHNTGYDAQRGGYSNSGQGGDGYFHQQ